MKPVYHAVNEEHGTYPNGEGQYMIIALYVNGRLVSKERVTRVEENDEWDFYEDIIMGDYLTFDVLAYAMGEDRAFWNIDEDCFQPCWSYPGELIDITPEEEIETTYYIIRVFSQDKGRSA